MILIAHLTIYASTYKCGPVYTFVYIKKILTGTPRANQRSLSGSLRMQFKVDRELLLFRLT